MIYLRNLSKSYGDRVLFKKLTISIQRGEKIGLVGPNGAGKSTLFTMILGKTEVSSGKVQINKGVRIGYLAQETNFTSSVSVLDEVIEGDATIIRLLKEKKDLETENKAGIPRYGEVLHDLEFLGYFDLEYKAKKVLSGLGFKEEDYRRSITHMSGGWQMRVLLAKLLTCRYDILLLDEPMNYLDLSAALWFKDYLSGFSGSFIMISHDRDFLTDVTNYTLVLENGLITKVRGNYEDYLCMCRQRRTHLAKQFAQQQKKRKQLIQFIHRFHGQPNKASQVRAKRKMLERMENIDVPEERRQSIRSFSFPQTRRSGYQVMALHKMSKSYGDIQVYRNFDFEVFKGEKAVFVGENGAGKSTLLKILAGVVDIDSGERTLGHNVDIGYFSQTRMDVLNPYNTVLDEASAAAGQSLLSEQVRTILGMFLFSGSDVDKKVSILSGGEKSRLILARLLVKPPNFLLLDEPTTHLDVDATDALIRALREYQGTVVFISHDIHFVRSIANVVFEVKQGRVRKFPGNFDYYWQTGRHKVSCVKDVSRLPQAKSKSAVKKLAVKEKGPADKDNLTLHNKSLSVKIRKLRNDKEKLQMELSVTKRILTTPRSYHSDDCIELYRERLAEVEARLVRIDAEIKKLKDSFR